MTTGVRKLLHYSIVWAACILAEAVLAVLFILGGAALTSLHLVLSAVALAAVLVAGLNLVILLKNRATARAHHQAVRVSLGASRASLRETPPP